MCKCLRGQDRAQGLELLALDFETFCQAVILLDVRNTGLHALRGTLIIGIAIHQAEKIHLVLNQI